MSAALALLTRPPLAVSATNSQTVVYVVLGFIGVGAIMLVAYGLMHRGDDDEVQRRLERYVDLGADPHAPAPDSATGVRRLVSPIADTLGALMARSRTSGKLSEDLAKADIKMKSSEWVLAVAGGTGLLALLAFLRFDSPVAAAVCLPIGYFGSGLTLRLLQSRRRKAFEKQLGDTIILLSNALKAGYSFAQAMNNVAKTASPPISDEFARATREIALGVSVDDSLNHMVKRNNSEDFDLMVTAVQIHRVVGGNLAEILDTIAHTIRERVRIKGEIRTLTAQARASGWIITVLPIALALILNVVSPDYFRPMLHETAGIIMMAIGGFSMAVGFALIQKIVKIEV